MKAKFLKSSEKKNVVEELKEIYGISELPYLLIETGKKKLRAFSGHLSKEEIIDLSKIINIEIIGMYLINLKDDLPRINFDAVSLLKNQVLKNIIKINKELLNSWLRGYDLEIETKSGIVILEYEDDLVGIGKSNGKKIYNYIPKERKIKSSIIY
ncbi:hypothetical protein HYV50_04585 [Candidatus Pacearchaeota archaeon]|nr:hypothetical protein [Candidatus Pacearchaeota archaeon]